MAKKICFESVTHTHTKHFLLTYSVREHTAEAFTGGSISPLKSVGHWCFWPPHICHLKPLRASHFPVLLYRANQDAQSSGSS